MSSNLWSQVDPQFLPLLLFRDALDRHARLVHPNQDHQPPVKQRRLRTLTLNGSNESSVSYQSVENSPSASNASQSTDVLSSQTPWEPIRFDFSDATTDPLPEVAVELPEPSAANNSSPDNIVSANFVSGPLDASLNFDFTSEGIFNFVDLYSPQLQPNETDDLLPSFSEPQNGKQTNGHTLLSWPQANHPDDSSTASFTSPQISGSSPASSTPLIEPIPSKDIFVNREKSEKSFLIDDNLYKKLMENLNTTQVFLSLIELMGRVLEVENS